MSDPIFILGCHRSGTSVAAGLLHDACGVAMGELMPPTTDNPTGSYEAQAVVDAHRGLLFQMERDWTCPPTTFAPERLDLGALREQVEIHRTLGDVWAVKDPRLMFLLPAWRHLGVGRTRLVAVVRAPADTISSIEQRDGIRQDRAEAIVDAYLRRLGEIALQVPLAVIRFSNDANDVLDQVRSLASSLRLDWDESVAESFFEARLVRHQSPHEATTPAYDAVVETAAPFAGTTVPTTDLDSLSLHSSPEWALDMHLGPRHSMQRDELWDLATFSSVPEPDVVEFVLDGARLGHVRRPEVRQLQQIEIGAPEEAGTALAHRRVRPHGIVAHGLLAGRSEVAIEHFFRSLHPATQVFSEVVVDVPDPSGSVLIDVEPAPVDQPSAATVRGAAEGCGWDHLTTQRVSPGRLGMVFRKRIPTDPDSVAAATDLADLRDRLRALEADAAVASRSPGHHQAVEGESALATERRRADAAERELERLRHRRSVKVALAIAQSFGGVSRRVRTWKRNR